MAVYINKVTLSNEHFVGDIQQTPATNRDTDSITFISPEATPWIQNQLERTHVLDENGSSVNPLPLKHTLLDINGDGEADTLATLYVNPYTLNKITIARTTQPFPIITNTKNLPVEGQKFGELILGERTVYAQPGVEVIRDGRDRAPQMTWDDLKVLFVDIRGYGDNGGKERIDPTQSESDPKTFNFKVILSPNYRSTFTPISGVLGAMKDTIKVTLGPDGETITGEGSRTLHNLALGGQIGTIGFFYAFDGITRPRQQIIIDLNAGLRCGRQTVSIEKPEEYRRIVGSAHVYIPYVPYATRRSPENTADPRIQYAKPMNAIAQSQTTTNQQRMRPKN